MAPPESVEQAKAKDSQVRRRAWRALPRQRRRFDHAAAATDMHVQKADELVPGRKRERGQGSSSDGNHPHDGLIPKKARAEDPQQQVSGKIEAGLEQEQIKLKKTRKV